MVALWPSQVAIKTGDVQTYPYTCQSDLNLSEITPLLGKMTILYYDPGPFESLVKGELILPYLNYQMSI